MSSIVLTSYINTSNYLTQNTTSHALRSSLIVLAPVFFPGLLRVYKTTETAFGSARQVRHKTWTVFIYGELKVRASHV